MVLWIVMIVLMLISIFLIFQCVQAVMGQYREEYDDGEYEDEPRRRGASNGGGRSARRRRNDYDDEYDEDDEYDDGDEYDGEYGDEYDDGYGGMPRRGRQDDYRRARRTDYDDSEEVERAPALKQFRILLENPNTWEKYTYQFYEAVGIGRAKDDPEFEQVLTVEGDPKVSKHHCAIIAKDGKLYLEDLGSTNGTFLNEKRVNSIVLIQKDDVIRLGETQLEVKKILRER